MPMVAGWALSTITGAAISVGVPKMAAFAAAKFALSAGANLALSVGASAVLNRRPGASRDPVEWVADTDMPIPFPFGRVGVAGKLVYPSDGYGPDNRYTSLVSVLAGAGPINAYVSFKSNDILTAFGAGDVAITGEHSGEMWLQRKLGAQPDTALSSPAGLDGGATVPKWGSTYKLSGKACCIQTLYENSKFSEYRGNEEKPLHTILGKFGWDPRLDSTWPGGSGSCRLDDPSTWVYITNGAIAALNWAIGMWEGDSGGGKYGVPYACTQVGGIGSSLDGIDVAAFVYAANVADANAWIISAWPDTAMDESAVLDLMLQSAGALRSRNAGRISCVSRGAPQSSLVTVTARDTAGPLEISFGQSRLERINTIVARYWSEEHGWQMTPLAPVTDDDWLTEDRGIKRSRGVDYPYVRLPDQAAQLAYYDIADAREPISGTAPFKPYMRRIKPGDCFTFNEPGFALNGLKVKCLTRSYDPITGVVRIGFRQETDAKHDAAMGRTGEPPVVIDPNGPPTVPTVPAPTVDSMAIVFDGAAPRARIRINNPDNDALTYVVRWRAVSGSFLSYVIEYPIPTAPLASVVELTTSVLPIDASVEIGVAFLGYGLTPATATWASDILSTSRSGARRPIGRSIPYPTSATDTTISILAFDAYMDTGETISLPADTITGLTASTSYGVFWKDGVGYEAEVSPATAHMTTGGWLFVGWQATEDGSGVFPTGDPRPGGWGGDQLTDQQETP